ncbi:MAG: TIGR02281 family clan AA aspartic protease [Pseudomonadota bacterium]
MSGDETAYFLYLLLLLLGVGGAFLFSRRRQLRQTVQQAAIWGLIFGGVIVLYGFSDTLEQQLFTGRAVANGDSYELVRRGDGHFHMTLTINGTPVDFIVDTGATQIVLTQDDARRIGLDPDNLVFLGRAQTANGTVSTASVVLDEVRLGDLTHTRVRATVNGGPLFQSLLGMTYLNRFSEITFRGDRLILRP